MDDSLAGKNIKCPNCQSIIQTPSVAGAPKKVEQLKPVTSSAAEKGRPANPKPVVAQPVSQQPVAARPVATRPIAASPVATNQPTARSSSAPQTLDGVDLGQLPLAPQGSVLPPSNWQPPRQKNKKPERFSLLKIVLVVIGGSGLLLCALGVGLSIVGWLTRDSDKAGPSSVLTQYSGAISPLASDSSQPASSAAVASSESLPKFPELGAPQNLGGVQLYDVDLATLNPAAQPGFATKLRVYLPANNPAPRSVPCVLVAPAGTTMLHGNALDASDYHDETLPYAQAGMAVIQYSLDGPMADMQSFSSEKQLLEAMHTAYLQFKAASAGVTNGRIALEFALAKLPQVDPARIYCAGHSSAATLALQLAVAEPRIAKCAAYAPASNMNLRLRELLAEPALRGVFPDLQNFVNTYCPYTNAHRINCPVFLFHARDDSNEPWSTTNDFASLLKRLNKNSTLVSVDRGDHYEPMISTGIPKAIEWFQQ